MCQGISDQPVTTMYNDPALWDQWSPLYEISDPCFMRSVILLYEISDPRFMRSVIPALWDHLYKRPLSPPKL